MASSDHRMELAKEMEETETSSHQMALAKDPNIDSASDNQTTAPASPLECRDSDGEMTLAKELREELECIICMEQKKLHLLPCAHRCCHACIVSLASGGDTVKCPICRREHTTPNEGFPVCLLSQFLKEKLQTQAQARRLILDDIPSDKGYKCSSCSMIVQAVCHDCHKFICFGCAVTVRCMVSSTGKHGAEALVQAVEGAVEKLEAWKVNAAAEISKLEEGLREKQKEIEEKKSVLRAAEMIDSSLENVERIELINQMCITTFSFRSLSKTPDHPTSLQFISQHETRSQCITVDYHSVTGDLLIGCIDGTKLLTKDSVEVVSVTNNTRNDAMAQLVEHNGDVLISHHEQEIITISQFDISRKVSKPIISFPMKSSKVSYLSCSDSYIVSLNKDNHGIELYDRVTEIRSKVGLPGTQRIFHTHFLADHCSLLVTCFHSGKYKLNKYILLKSAKPEGSVTILRLVWSSCQLPYARGIAVGDNGLIFVSEKGRKRIYVLNSDGKKLCELGCDKLPDIHKVISLYGDRLAVAGWDTNAVFIYKVISCVYTNIQNK